EFEALVERADELLGGAAEPGQPGGVERGGAVGERGGGPFACGRQRDGRNAARDERPLLVKGEREAEVDQLLHGPGASRLRPRLLEDAFRSRLDERGRGRAGAVAGDDDARRPATRDRIEVD